MNLFFSILLRILFVLTILVSSIVFDIPIWVWIAVFLVGILAYNFLFRNNEGIETRKNLISRLRDTSLVQWFSKIKNSRRPKHKTTYSYTFNKKKRRDFKFIFSPKLIKGGVALVLLVLLIVGGVALFNKISIEKEFNSDKLEEDSTIQNDASGSSIDLVKPTPPTSETFAVIVGIDDYQYADDYSGDLRFAKDDAFAFEKFLLSESGGKVPEGNISTITDNKATKEYIQSELKRLSEKAGPSDRLIFYFSGHGRGDYFLPSDFNSYDENYLTIRSLDYIFINSKAKHKLLIADACIDTNTQRGRGGSSAAQDFNNDLNQYQPSFVHLRSCQDNEWSYESAEYQNGIFSYRLIEGLKGKADSDGDRIVTLEEVYDYVRNKVNSDVNLLLGVYQTPQLKGTADPNMPMSTLKE